MKRQLMFVAAASALVAISGENLSVWGQSLNPADLPIRCTGSHSQKAVKPGPILLFGASPSFESWIVRSFPPGSCVEDLVAWMDSREFEPVLRSDTETYFIDEPAEFDRNKSRRKSGKYINLRGLMVKSLVGRSYYSIAWNSNAEGRITEIFADSEQLHFDLP
jgi:hypothetical protein